VIVVRGVSCLNGPVPHVGREVPDEMFALLRRERARAAQASPLVRARILEAIPALFPDVSDLWPEPPCHDELEREGTDALEATPLVVDRELIARIRAVHDASSLIGLALRDEGTIADYRLGPDEPGPAPTKAFLRYRAFANIPSYWFADNRVDGRRLLLDRLRVGTDATEVLLLHGAAEAIFDQSLFGHPEKAAGTDGPMLLGGFIADVGKRLQEPPDRAALELVLLRLGDIGRFGVRFDHESAARGVVRTVLSAKGEVHLTRGVPGAARDLAEAARGALFDLDTPQRSIGYTDLSPPRRKRFDPRADWLDREPAGGSPSPVDRAARVRDLDLELGAVTHNAPRCYLIRQLGEWLSDAEAEARFEAMIAPAFEGERVVLSTESLCRLNVALGMEGVSADRRAALAARLLRTPLPKPGSRDLTLDEHGPAIGHPWDEDPVRQSAAAALNRHPEWVDTSTDIRSWLEEKAREPIPRDHPPAQTWSVLNASFERAMDFHLSGGPEAHPETARGILAAWIGSIRAALLEKPASHIYYGEVVQRRIHTLGELGRRAGMVPEIGAFLEDLKGRRDAVIARYLLDLETPAGK
jgi:hypothetical protein